MNGPEYCYVCGLPMLNGQWFYRLESDDGLFFHVHKHCMVQMEVVLDDAPLDTRATLPESES